jgi:DNA-directed RNA polymerase subunit E'/Rpb7
MFSYHAPLEREVVAGNVEEITDEGAWKSKLDILVNFQEQGNYMYFDIDFNTDIYNQRDIRKMIFDYKSVLKYLLQNPDKDINSLDFDAEKAHKVKARNLSKLKKLRRA